MSADGPTAAPAHWPYREHRTMAEVIADEDFVSRARKCSLCGQYRKVQCAHRACGLPLAVAA